MFAQSRRVKFHFPTSAKREEIRIPSSQSRECLSRSILEDNLPAPRSLHSDWYRPDYYEQLVAAGGVARNPLGPDVPFDPSEPTEYKKVQRDGSFRCTDQYCSRYIVGALAKGEVSTGMNHLGFRCVKDARSASALSTGA
jgi:hypothetical protein